MFGHVVPPKVTPVIGDQNEEASGFFIEPVLGYRTWRLDDSELVLRGCIYTVEWPHVEDAVAECKKAEHWHPPSVVPVKECNCGFYGYDTYQTLRRAHGYMSPLRQVRGVVIGWGKVWIHEDGWKAKYARPIALLHWPERRNSIQTKFEAEKHMEDAFHWNGVAMQIAEKYNIPYVNTPNELEDLGRQYLL